MRRVRPLVVAILIGFAALAFGNLGEGATGVCVGDFVRSGVRLPAPIAIETSISTKTGHFLRYASYRIACDGRVRRIANTPGRVPPEAALGAPPGMWWAIRHGHLMIGRGNRSLWRSRGEFQSRYGIGAIEIDSRTIAFSYGSNLYLAPHWGAERPIGRAEDALGFTSGGLYTISWVRGLLLRSGTGAILKKVVHWPLGSDYFVARGRLYFIAHGALLTARGVHIQQLASLASLGVSADVWLQPLSTDPWSQRAAGLFALEDNDHLTVMRPDGSVFARTLIPPRADTIAGLTVAPNATAVAFAAPTRRTSSETVYLLRAGTDTAVPVLTERHVAFEVCAGGGATLEWRRGWLLYSSTEQRLAAIDTTGAHRTVELTNLIRTLPGTRGGFTAYWSGQAPAF